MRSACDPRASVFTEHIGVTSLETIPQSCELNAQRTQGWPKSHNSTTKPVGNLTRVWRRRGGGAGGRQRARPDWLQANLTVLTPKVPDCGTLEPANSLPLATADCLGSNLVHSSVAMWLRRWQDADMEHFQALSPPAMHDDAAGQSPTVCDPPPDTHPDPGATSVPVFRPRMMSTWWGAESTSGCAFRLADGGAAADDGM